MTECDHKCTLKDKVEELKGEIAILQINLAIYKNYNTKIKAFLKQILQECIIDSPSIEPDSDSD